MKPSNSSKSLAIKKSSKSFQNLPVIPRFYTHRAVRDRVITGEEIHARLSNIVDRKLDKATGPLRARIDKLESEGGPVFEVKKIRFAMESSTDWSDLEAQLDELLPYAREFDYAVKNEVLDAVREATWKTRRGMPLSVAYSVNSLLAELMPVGFGGMHYPAKNSISNDDLSLLERIEHTSFELTWDACRYLRDLAIVEIGARRYWSLIRFATRNRLQRLQSECLANARRCVDICKEERRGKSFPEGQLKLEEEIKDALDAFEGKEKSTVADMKSLAEEDRAGSVQESGKSSGYIVRELSPEHL